MANHQMLVAADARAYGIVGGMSVGGRKQPRTVSYAFTDCVCTDREGKVIRIIPRNTRPKSKSVATRSRANSAKRAHAEAYEQLLRLGAIGNNQ